MIKTYGDSTMSEGVQQIFENDELQRQYQEYRNLETRYKFQRKAARGYWNAKIRKAHKMYSKSTKPPKVVDWVEIGLACAVIFFQTKIRGREA